MRLSPLSARPAAQAVLAHPQRYKLSAGALGNLCSRIPASWVAARSEVSLPSLSPKDHDRLARLARTHGLGGLGGLGFPRAGPAVAPSGPLAKLPEGIEPLRMRLQDHCHSRGIH